MSAHLNKNSFQRLTVICLFWKPVCSRWRLINFILKKIILYSIIYTRKHLIGSGKCYIKKNVTLNRAKKKMLILKTIQIMQSLASGKSVIGKLGSRCRWRPSYVAAITVIFSWPLLCGIALLVKAIFKLWISEKPEKLTFFPWRKMIDSGIFYRRNLESVIVGSMLRTFLRVEILVIKASELKTILSMLCHVVIDGIRRSHLDNLIQNCLFPNIG